MNNNSSPSLPEILAPAGNRASFLAALSAGADAVYCGLKTFSARMQAENFSTEDLGALVRLAHRKGCRVYLTLNTLIKPNEWQAVAGIVQRIRDVVRPDGIIVQDLATVELARKIGLASEIHLSTLANVSFAAALSTAKASLGVDRIVLPRELNIDEIKAMARACPDGLGLEVFVHGALCYGVSGRCYWSSWFGGKSGLRGRCVQPCRRVYRQEYRSGRAFSCQDLSMDVLVKVLKGVEQIKAWKIEGRKKGPHYVYYTVSAYRLLRDHGADPNAKRDALQLLEMALGRPGTHYHFLPQRPQHPVPGDGRTGSGLFVGVVKGPKAGRFLSPRIPLLPEDRLRVGYEDESGHAVIQLRKHVPRKGRFAVRPSRGKSPGKGTPVFLIDRREKALTEKIRSLEEEIRPIADPEKSRGPISFIAPKGKVFRADPEEVTVQRTLDEDLHGSGVWVEAGALIHCPDESIDRIWWWLPPVIWPSGEDALAGRVEWLLQRGAVRFVLNSPWQTALVPPSPGRHLWAGPFCNVANPLSIHVLKKMGFTGVFVSPELAREDFLALPGQSELPLGIVIFGNWPLTISRIPPQAFDPKTSFASPRGEESWFVRYGENCWVYPNWSIDLRAHQKELVDAGYSLFVHLLEPVPKGIAMKERPGLWNWEGELA